MAEYSITSISQRDRRSLAAIDELLLEEGIRRDAHLDYTCAVLDEEQRIIATGSCFENTLRCLAVSHRHQGEGLMNMVISHLVELECMRGHIRLFLYTKPSAAAFFAGLGFHELARTEGKGAVVFMENDAGGFSHCLARFQTEAAPLLPPPSDPRPIGSVVMNANPFTNGHLYLLEEAARRCSLLHLFLVSEDVSLIPFAVRKQLAGRAIAHAGIPNICLHESGPYIISNATFPSYFLADDAEAVLSHARLDAAVFAKIAGALSIAVRFVGEEPFSRTTARYNQVLKETLPAFGIQLVEIPRCTAPAEQIGTTALAGALANPEGSPELAISASLVREKLKAGDIRGIKPLVPPPVFDYFQSDAAAPVLTRIKAASDVIHH